MLFKGDLVRAILAGTKTVTRRLVKPGRVIGKGWAGGVGVEFGTAGCAESELLRHPNMFLHRCPYGEPGDVLYVRETWAGPDVGPMLERAAGFERNHYIHYRADGERTVDGRPYRWRPGIHMPRWASRIDLEITDVRVERLQEITEEEAIAEGMQAGFEQQRAAFAKKWDEINGPYGPTTWRSNPWVWRVAFRRIKP